ncbi:uncharacterized protein LOC125776740 isoform X2 [Bactrocera dorsalis]|uniref:Uncharacterized protein LOC125776740 isoform X2 n=1 Tax=Bactrocera dorsalis TaxID=27457 RepID=A0ABM3JAJ4_BACDO|nr:uncharacterized protein LOC125776740 isoform X2 [Bactrocera dorsalis]
MAEELRNKLYKYRFKKQRQKVIQIFKSKLIEFWMLGMGEPSLSEGEQVGINVVEKDVDLNKFQNQDSNAKFTKNVEYELAQNSDDEDERESVSELLYWRMESCVEVHASEESSLIAIHLGVE